MTLRGIDISSWQAGIDLSYVPADFVIVKATGGTGYTNPEFRRQADSALKAGRKLGIYHFAAEKGCAGSAAQESAHFLKAFAPYKGKAIPILDWEADAVNYSTSWAKEWLDAVAKSTGAKPWFYSYSNAVNSHDYSSIAKYPLWIAAYYAGYEPMGYHANPPLYGGTGAWGKATAYQYTSTGRISGWSGNLDLNIFYGSGKDWDGMCGNGGVDMSGKVQKFCDRMVYWCTTGDLGYDQQNRWDIRIGGECDCSSLVYWCLWEAGLLVKPSGNLYNYTLYTGTLRRDLKNAGWKELSPNLSQCRPGDVLLNDGSHVAAVVSGSGSTAKLAQASIDENGNIAGGRSGDQTGSETNIRTVYSYPWNVILRPPAESVKPKEDDDLKQVVNTGGNVYRLYNSKNGHHMLTLSSSERSSLKKSGWKDEGVAFKAPKGGTVPIYRMYNPSSGDHLFTTAFNEAQTVQKSGWQYEGVPFFGKDSGSPVYRLYKDGKHLFTADRNERDVLRRSGWKSEGTAWKF